jgi:hypothetical protein
MRLLLRRTVLLVKRQRIYRVSAIHMSNAFARMQGTC